MTAHPRGITLIINNASFHPDVRHSPRHGSEEDVRQLEGLFTRLDFSVQKEVDLSKKKLEDVLKEVTSQDHSNYDCFVLWLMSHGSSGKVVCFDGKMMPIQQIHDMFSKCETLSGKPKLFFIQACRGVKEDEGMNALADHDASSPRYQENKSNESAKADSVIQLRIPRHSDFLYAFSTVDKYKAYRDETLGSHYVRCFVEAFDEHVAHEHILDILTVVNHKVSKMEATRPLSTNENETKTCKQMPEVRHTLRKKVHFSTHSSGL